MPLRRLSIATLALALGACASVPAPEAAPAQAPSVQEFQDPDGSLTVEIREAHSVLAYRVPSPR